jgi:hypothetical protein
MSKTIPSRRQKKCRRKINFGELKKEVNVKEIKRL